MTAESIRKAAPEKDRSVQGVLLCILGYAFISVQDASVKWLVADHSVFEILFWRSLAVTLVCVAVGRTALVRRAWHSASRKLLLARGLLSICAWLLYYTGGRDMSLAQMTTLYFSAPVMVTVLARMILKERASRWQWLAVLLGFVGVVVACKPSMALDPVPVLLTLLAALCWALTFIQMRQVDKATTVPVQLLITNVVFMVCTGVTLPWSATPGLVGSPAMFGMIGAGLMGGIAQYLLFSSFLRATATLLAPFEYSGLIWAFLLSSLIWGTVLEAPLLVGAGLIALSGTLAILFAPRRSRQLVAEGPPA